MAILGELVIIKGGGTPSKQVPEYWGGEIPWASVKDLKSTELEKTIDCITELGLKNSSATLIPAGTIVVPTRMALGKVAKTSVDMAINQDLKALLIKDESVINKNYLIRFLESQAKNIESQGKGATVKGIRLDVLRALEIPLPPMVKQKMLAATLDKADLLRKKRQQAIELIGQFLQSVFWDMFGEPVANTKNWIVLPLTKGIRSIEAGWSAKGSNLPASQGQFGVLKISSVTSGIFRSAENKAVEGRAIPVGKKLVFPKADDLLFSRANTRELVAATALVDEDYDHLFLPDKLWRIHTNEKLLPEFLHYLIQQPKMRDRLTSQATGTSGSMLNISKKKLLETMAIFPPLPIQRRFADIYSRTRRLALKHRAANVETKNLFNSLSQRAFNDQL